jgi:GT2 family glycosyltransferase
MKPSFISCVVPLFNHVEQTHAMLESLLLSLPRELDYEVILVDDASTDGTREWLQTLKDPRIQTVLNHSNLGYARTNNVGVRLARGELIVLLNNDLLFEPGWLEPMLEILLSPCLNAGLVGNVQYRVADGRLDHAGVRLNAVGQLEHIKDLPGENVSYTKVLAVTGACMLLRKADLVAQGGFDEQYLNGCEDIDLCFKIRATHKAIYVAIGSRIRHHVGLSRESSALSNEHNSRNLFGNWRRTIKQELISLWATLLKSGPAAYANYLQGHLDPDFMGTPRTAAGVIAEAMLLRQEYRWARDLDETDPNVEIVDRCSSKGLLFVPNLNGYTLKESVEFTFENVCSVRNFYIC